MKQSPALAAGSVSCLHSYAVRLCPRSRPSSSTQATEVRLPHPMRTTILRRARRFLHHSTHISLQLLRPRTHPLSCGSTAGPLRTVSMSRNARRARGSNVKTLGKAQREWPRCPGRESGPPLPRPHSPPRGGPRQSPTGGVTTAPRSGVTHGCEQVNGFSASELTEGCAPGAGMSSSGSEAISHGSVLDELRAAHPVNSGMNVVV